MITIFVKKLDIFKSGTCPYCNSELNDDYHKLELSNLIEKYEIFKKDLLDLKKRYN